MLKALMFPSTDFKCLLDVDVYIFTSTLKTVVQHAFKLLDLSLDTFNIY